MNYYNEYDPKAAAWLRELIRAGEIPPADVWECQSPLCTAYGLLWHTPREKDECGKLRCALIALVKAEEASIDQFTAKEIDAIERALDRANRVLYPERYSSPNAQHEPRRAE